jgi:hypothetical protein
MSWPRPKAENGKYQVPKRLKENGLHREAVREVAIDAIGLLGVFGDGPAKTLVAGRGSWSLWARNQVLA